MVLSMTGFSRTSFKKDITSGFLEIRSLNHRHLDVSVKLPETFRSFEKEARELIKSRVTRGKIDCHLTIEIEQTNKNLLSVDKNTLFSLSALHKELSDMFSSKLDLNFVDILKWPNVLNVPDIHFEHFSETLTELFTKSLDDLLSAREREGYKIKQILEEKIELFKAQLSAVKTLSPASIDEARIRYKERITQLNDGLENTRLEQECALLVQKLDISEELDRIASHLEEMTRVIIQGGPVGRRLDFILQELGRETNTLGAKSNNVEISAGTIEMKVLLEQMREQVQNIE